MKIRLPSLQLVSGIGLLLLFPFFFLYHSAVALVGLPAFAGGLFGPVAMILAPILMILQIRAFQRGISRLTITDIVFLFLCLYMLCWGLIHFFFSYGYQARPDVWMQTFTTVVFWIVLYVIFRNFDLQDRKLFTLMLISGIAILGITIANQHEGMFYAKELSTSEGAIASYQGFARSAFIVSLFLLCAARTRWIIFIWAASLPVLYLLGARTEFFAFLPIGLIVLYLRSGFTRFVTILTPFLVIISLFLFIFAMSGVTNDRIDKLLTSSDNDTSLENRNYFSQFALETIRNNPVTGDYGSHVLVPSADDSTGNYAHNALSAWVSFGLIGFITFVFLLVRGFFLSTMKMITSRRKDAVSIFIFAMAIYFLLVTITAKSVYYEMFGAGFGLFALMEEQKAHSSKFAKRARSKHVIS